MVKKIVLAACMAFFSLWAGHETARADVLEQKPQVIVYYFHSNYRCVSCHKMESYTQEALETFFKKKFENGSLVFKALNVDEKDNAHFVDDYQLYTNAVVLSLIEGGREIKHKNLDKAFDRLKNKKNFIDYIRDEMEVFLDEHGNGGVL